MTEAFLYFIIFLFLVERILLLSSSSCFACNHSLLFGKGRDILIEREAEEEYLESCGANLSTASHCPKKHYLSIKEYYKEKACCYVHSSKITCDEDLSKFLKMLKSLFCRDNSYIAKSLGSRKSIIIMINKYKNNYK